MANKNIKHVKSCEHVKNTAFINEYSLIGMHYWICTNECPLMNINGYALVNMR